jgi:PRC-barrel domain
MPGAMREGCATRFFGKRAATALAALIGAAAAGTAVGAAPPPAVPSAAPKPPPPRVKTVVRSSAEGILARPVRDAKGQTIGYVVDVLIDAEGRPQAAVIEFAGFFGLGDRDVAVDWKALLFSVENDQILIRVALEPSALKAMPPYKRAAKSVPVATPAAHATAGSP